MNFHMPAERRVTKQTSYRNGTEATLEPTTAVKT